MSILWLSWSAKSILTLTTSFPPLIWRGHGKKMVCRERNCSGHGGVFIVPTVCNSNRSVPSAFHIALLSNRRLSDPTEGIYKSRNGSGYKGNPVMTNGPFLKSFLSVSCTEDTLSYSFFNPQSISWFDYVCRTEVKIRKQLSLLSAQWVLGHQ